MCTLLKTLTLGILILGISCRTPLVRTPLGIVLGYHKTSHGGRKFSAFEGIPFAKPPIGQKRFQQPEPIDPWLGTWNATLPTECAQRVMTLPNATTGQEDCLHVNVYVPRQNPNPSDNFPVVVHIHGGAFSYRSGHSYSRPDFLMDHEVIFVTFNYRLGVLGFLSTEDDVVPGNNGLKDQVLALKWVRDNIASFGGDPSSITITGLSAGGASVHLHYFSPLSAGLFHRGFSQSGVALNPWVIQEEPLMRAQKLADAVGCPTGSSRVLVDCLKQRPVKHILDKVSSLFSYRFMPCIPFGPVVEKGSNPFLERDPYQLLKTGQVHDVPWLVSVTTHEGFFPVAYFDDLDYIDDHWEELAPGFLEFNHTLHPSLWSSTSRKIKQFYLNGERFTKDNLLKLVRIFSDRFFLVDAETAVRMQARVTNSSVYYYSFGYPGDGGKTVGHAADAKYFFGPVFGANTLTPNELRMKDLLLEMVVSFAKTGKAKLGEANWEAIRDDGLMYLRVNGFKPEEMELETTEELNEKEFWKSLEFLEGENVVDLRDE